MDTHGVSNGHDRIHREREHGAVTVSGYVLAGTDPFSITVDPSQKFVYVANFFLQRSLGLHDQGA